MEEGLKIRRPTTVGQQLQSRASHSFTGLSVPEEVGIKLDLDETQYAPEVRQREDTEKAILKRRLEKLEMLLEVYDIPSPPWKER
jgi:hypothetical protein